MLSNINYSSLVESAKIQGKSHVDFSQAKRQESYQTAVNMQDTVTLSAEAKALNEGKPVEKISPIYVKPETAASLLSANQNSEDGEEVQAQSSGEKFAEVMQGILDKRMGIDRDKLKELDAMIEQIAKDENLSPEEKEKMIEQLQQMKEEMLKENLDNQKFVKAQNKEQED